MFTFFSLLVTLSSSLSIVIDAFQPKTFSARLIHRSSHEFPLFDPNYTRDEHLKKAKQTSLARSQFFNQYKTKAEVNYIAAPVGSSDFYMKFAMGTPPVDRYGLLDTGSEFIWFQCYPCFSCFDGDDVPLFYTNQSSSYERVKCLTKECEMLPPDISQPCLWQEYCPYSISYMDGTTSKGVVSMETLTLSTKTLEKIVFGCGNDSYDPHGTPGIIGLSNISTSLIRQLSVSHFSYYIFANETHTYGEVHFGPGASLSENGANTQLIPSENGLYYLNLTGISVDGSDIYIPPGFFDKPEDPSRGIIIDTGSTQTILADEVYDKLVEAILDEMYSYDQPVQLSDYDVCFRDDVDGAPEVTFQFSGLDFTLCNSNLWREVRGYNCLDIERAPEGFKTSILGLRLTRNVQVGFDLEKDLLTLNFPEACPQEAIDFMV